MDNKYKVGNFFESLRKEKGMTQAELALKLGVTDRAISKWENGKSLPSVGILNQLSVMYNVSINELLQGERGDTREFWDESTRKLLEEKRNLKIILMCMGIVCGLLIGLTATYFIFSLLSVKPTIWFFCGTMITVLSVLIMCRYYRGHLNKEPFSFSSQKARAFGKFLKITQVVIVALVSIGFDVLIVLLFTPKNLGVVDIILLLYFISILPAFLYCIFTMIRMMEADKNGASKSRTKTVLVLIDIAKLISFFVFPLPLAILYYVDSIKKIKSIK